MIEIVIPTLKRLSKQITLSNIPDEHKRFATLVVQPQEENEAKKKGVTINHAKELYEEGIHWLAGTTHADKPMTLQFGSVQLRSDGGIQESSKVYDYTVGDFVFFERFFLFLTGVLAIELLVDDS